MSDLPLKPDQTGTALVPTTTAVDGQPMPAPSLVVPPVPPASRVNWTRIVVSLVALVAIIAAYFSLPVLQRWTKQNRTIQGRSGYWLPNEGSIVTDALQGMCKGAKEVRVISSVFGISSWAQVLSQARRQQNTHVILVLDGTLANRARNLKNQDFFRKNGMTFILTTEAHNLHCVLVAGTDGWIATGPLNSRLLTLPGRIYRMDPKEVELLWQYSTGLIEKGEDGSGTIVDQTGQ